jgi:myo-inositol-1(or 4)-monophosphatase
MIREAGGTVSELDGGDLLTTGNVVCGNEYVHNELIRLLRPLK